MRAKLKAVKVELMRRRHEPIPAQGRWLGQVVGGFFGYHAVPTNSAALSAFLHHVKNLWHAALHAEQEAIVRPARIIDAVEVDDAGLHQSAQLEQMVPVAAVPREP